MRGFCIALTILLPFQLFATVKRWNGSVSGMWTDIQNWTPAGAPAETDDIILDNSILLTDFRVTTPSQSVSVLSLEIAPASGRLIEIQIPASNVIVPAMSFLSTGSSLIIRSGGIFRNSSGVTSGQSLQVSGKMILLDGGTYIHNTRASHATGIIAKLSTDAGTDRGIFEFDVPGGAYAISMSNRNYGSLRLSSLASDNAQTYNATGTSISNIRGDLLLGKGVTLNLDLEKTLTIAGDLRQEGGILNLASQPNNLQFILKGDLIQDTAGLITETSTGLPTVVFEGSGTQAVSLGGSCSNSVAFTLNNSSGLWLTRNFTFSFLFKFQSGKVISGNPGIFKIGSIARIEGASPLAFVDGPVTKLGQADIIYPVGKQIDYAPLEISGAGGTAETETTVSYYHGNPRELFGEKSLASEVLRISSLEYWKVKQNLPSPPFVKVTLGVGPYSHATLLSKLVVMGWDQSKKSWQNHGNSSYSGVATGTITGSQAELSEVLTIGTTVPDQNPLPVYFENLKGVLSPNEFTLSWQAYNQQPEDRFIVETSEDGFQFSSLIELVGDPLSNNHQIGMPWQFGDSSYFRVRLLAGGHKEIQSQSIFIRRKSPVVQMKLYPVPATTVLHVIAIAGKAESVLLEVKGIGGRRLYSGKFRLQVGRNVFDIPIENFPAGLHVLQYRAGKEMGSLMFLKK